jgi:hypothetical protein
VGTHGDVAMLLTGLSGDEQNDLKSIQPAQDGEDWRLR